MDRTNEKTTTAHANCGNTVLATGLFVCKDENNNDCRIGDKVIISCPPERVYLPDKDAVFMTERTYYEGVLMLSIKKGYYLKGEKDIHFQPPLHGEPHRNSVETWKWRRV